MNKNSQVYSVPKGEHQCDKERQITKEICNVLEKRGTEEGAKFLANAFVRSIENNDAKQRKRKSVFIIALLCIAGAICFTCVFELMGKRWGTIGQYFLPLAESIVTIVFAICKMIRMPERTRLRQGDEGFAEGMLEWGKDLWHQLTRVSGLHVLILCMIIFWVSFLIAQREPIKFIKVFFSGGMYAMAHCDDHNNSTDPVTVADGGSDKISVSYEMKFYLADEDETMIAQLDKAEVTNEEKNVELHLSNEEYDRIFTSWENGSDGYETQEQLNDVVLSAVQRWCSEKRDNVFDKAPEQGGAPQDDKDVISRISESEQPDDSFSDIEGRLDSREIIAKDYPKRTLMQLIANGYHGLALRLVWHEGIQSTIIYYYGQSILCDFECLKFADNTDKIIKKRLAIIAQRYEDIAYVCPDFERVEEARNLAVAFRYAADQY